MLGKKLIQAAAGNVGAAGGLGIEELFQTWLYTGNSSTQTITNGIDLAGEGGVVWIKCRTTANGHALFTTGLGTAGQRLSSNATSGLQSDNGQFLQSFNANGFQLGNDSFVNATQASGGGTYASWTFRKAPGFFDVVTYVGNGSTQNIAHSLGSVPGFVVIKRTDSASNWICWHRSINATNNDYLALNTTDPVDTTNQFSPWPWNSTTPTSTQFSVGYNGGMNQDFGVNVSGGTYVAYLFAHDEQIFGEGGDQSVIKCGSFTATGSYQDIDLGWEPQWILFKNTSIAGPGWFLLDTMRGWVNPDNNNYLHANEAAAETVGWGNGGYPTATGWRIRQTAGQFFIYIAIRRGPMKTPTSGTEVFGLNARTGTGSNATVTGGQVADATLIKNRGSAVGDLFAARLTSTGYVETSSTASEVAAGTTILQSNPWDVMDGVKVGTTSTITNASGNTFINYLFRRAPGFFDVVAYTGTTSSGTLGSQTLSHSLGVAPELIISKPRNTTANWVIADTAANNVLNFTTAAASGGVDFSETSTTFAARTFAGAPYTSYETNVAGSNYIAYLFATLPGVSKVFSFTGNGTSQTIDCGFAAGARFVLLKRTDSTGNWLVADTARGIVSGNDPLLYLNSTAAEITTLDWIDPHSSGFIVNQEATANANVGGATYIGLAIA